jgi:hypothetical protein
MAYLREDFATGFFLQLFIYIYVCMGLKEQKQNCNIRRKKLHLKKAAFLTSVYQAMLEILISVGIRNVH